MIGSRYYKELPSHAGYGRTPAEHVLWQKLREAYAEAALCLALFEESQVGLPDRNAPEPAGSAPRFLASVFVQSLHKARKQICALNRAMEETPVSAALAQFDDAFDGVKGLRDNEAHSDERARGLANDQLLVPTNDRPIWMDQLRGSIFWATVAKGSLKRPPAPGNDDQVARIAVTHETLAALHAVIMTTYGLLAAVPPNGRGMTSIIAAMARYAADGAAHSAEDLLRQLRRDYEVPAQMTLEKVSEAMVEGVKRRQLDGTAASIWQVGLGAQPAEAPVPHSKKKRH